MAYSQHTIYGGALVTVIVAACLAGVAITGGPGQARKQKEDRARLTALSETALALACYQQAFDGIPEDLSIVEEELLHVTSEARQQTPCASATLRKDPVSDEYFRLKRQDGAVTQICADFATDSSGSEYGTYAYYRSRTVIPDLNEAREAPGEYCFELNLEAELD